MADPQRHDPDIAPPGARGTARGAFADLGDVVLAAAAERSLVGTLRRLVAGAAALTGARYAAVGVPDETGAAFRQFLHVGMPPDVVATLGPLPRTHGLLGAMLSDPRSYHTPDITGDPRFEGWPPAHPPMRHFLGVPMVTGGEVVGAFYLTGEERDPPFADQDRELMAVLAAHAAVAVDNARLLEASRDTAVAQERARLSRELHDAVAQSVFGLRLTARTAARRIGTDPAGAAQDLLRIEEQASSALRELRAAIEQLQPPNLDEHGLAAVVRSHAELLGRGRAIEVRVAIEPAPEDPRWQSLGDVAPAVLRILQEALANATRHASATAIDLNLRLNRGMLEAAVVDDGTGFDAERGARRGLGLVSMHERAESVGAALSIRSRPGKGTEVRVSAGGRS